MALVQPMAMRNEEKGLGRGTKILLGILALAALSWFAYGIYQGFRNVAASERAFQEAKKEFSSVGHFAVPHDGSCFSAHDGPGCDNVDFQKAVCTKDPVCCEEGFDFDDYCAGIAREWYESHRVKP